MDFGQDSPELMDISEVSSDSFYDDYSSADTFDEATLKEDDNFGCGLSSCSYCGGKGYYWSCCGENVPCVKCGGSGIGS